MGISCRCNLYCYVYVKLFKMNDKKWIIITIILVMVVVQSNDNKMGKKTSGLCSIPFRCSEDLNAVELCNKHTGEFFTLYNCDYNKECGYEQSLPTCVEKQTEEPKKQSIDFSPLLLLGAVVMLIFIKTKGGARK